MFSCLRHSGKCEWISGNLEGFTDWFNEECGTTYRLGKCFECSDDADRRSLGPRQPRPEPEVLLLGEMGEQPMVLEKKIVVWPRDYLRDHQLMHDFFDAVESRLPRRLFENDVYVLEVSVSGLLVRNKNKRQIQGIASAIATVVLDSGAAVRKSGGIAGAAPIPWSFRRLPNEKREEETPQSGLGIIVQRDDTNCIQSVNANGLQRLSNQISQEVSKQLLASAKKFQRYSRHRKIVLLEFVGDYLLDINTKEIVATAEQPSSIDQVWVCEPVELSAWDQRTCYFRAR
jgi:hypothetical protein